ncbi:flagellar assembly protein FliH [Noviherbaspirillum massiliense]|uniref:flagellar assembly protein FliH n=1 Tax=Noviherbaspirillum massiliense TaxID=1465823 RepID=UPI0002F609CD|nr:flagellar assembly protein FliH [Noviherbaspirillum massiliense]
MSSTVIPKEKLSAYQRWELASFDDFRPAPAAPQNEAENAEMLAALREQATQEGHAAGHAEGYAAGLEAGRAAAAEETAQLLRLAETFGHEIAKANEMIADDMLNLSLDVAKAMLKTALNVRPELILPVIGEAIRYLPTVQQPALLFLHPEDAVLVRERMGDELEKAAWRITEDAHMERGGCRIETPSNQIDASPSTRWQRIAAALGKESDWLAE